MPLLPGAEPYDADGGPIGVLLLHGLTGTPQGLRSWAEHLAVAGYTVALPRLPGHGTRWQELALTRWPDWYAEAERGFDALHDRCAAVFVMGLSMGGTLALRLAEQRPDLVSGLVLVNPSIVMRDPRLIALPLLRHVVPTFPAIAGDIAKPGVTELAYDRLPLQAFWSLTRLWRLVRADLGAIRAPILLYRSAGDHVVAPINAELLKSGVRCQLEERVLPDSYHVATLDNDAATIFAGSADFVRARRPAATG